MKTHALCRPPRGALGIDQCTPRRGSCALRSGHRGQHDANLDLIDKRRAMLWRLGLDNRWGRDNGDPGRAFVGMIEHREDGNDSVECVVWVASCKCKDATCPRWKALEYVRETLGIESVSVHERPRAEQAGSTRVR